MTLTSIALTMSLILSGCLTGFAIQFWNKWCASERKVGRVTRDIDHMREKLADLTGWQPDGRLPDDWPEIVRQYLTPKETALEKELAYSSAMLLTVAQQSMIAISPPFIIGGSRPDLVEQNHIRLLQFLESIEKDPSPLLPSLVNGEFDALFSYWRRLCAFSPDAEQMIPYTLSATLVIARLMTEDVHLYIPAPLTFVTRDHAELTTNDLEGLHRNSVIFEHLSRARIAGPSASESLVIDCLVPGWSGPNTERQPQVLVWDRSWQE